ncbi:uncharacterized protein [Dysidea avara]|uniref:uncharacterized protein isoform X2 n=1 Tax=Dysidea avara TaxID=196820 RepID=UPI00331CAF13
MADPPVTVPSPDITSSPVQLPSVNTTAGEAETEFTHSDGVDLGVTAHPEVISNYNDTSSDSDTFITPHQTDDEDDQPCNHSLDHTNPAETTGTQSSSANIDSSPQASLTDHGTVAAPSNDNPEMIKNEGSSSGQYNDPATANDNSEIKKNEVSSGDNKTTDAPSHIDQNGDILRCTEVIPSDTADTLTNSIDLYDIPQKIRCNEEFNSLLTRYIDILNSMPEDYSQTLHLLQNHISDDQMVTLLDCPDHVTGNRMILDCLVEKLLHCKNDLLSLCHQLSRINSSALLVLVNEIRKELGAMPYTEVNSTEMITSALNFITNSEHREIIGRYYHRLCQCIPSDYDRSINKLLRMNLFNSNAFESIYSTDNKNEAIVDLLIVCSASVQDCTVLCEVLQKLIEDDTHKAVIETLKYELRLWKFDGLLCDHHRGIIRKHYYNLCESMPSDHMKSITILLQLKVLHDKALQSICSCPTVGSKNELILDTLIFVCAQDGDFLLLCDMLQALSEEAAMNEAVEAFRNDYLWELGSTSVDGSSVDGAIEQPPVKETQDPPPILEGSQNTTVTDSCTVDTAGSSNCSQRASDCPLELSFVDSSRPWTIKDFKGIPTSTEIHALSAALTSLSPNSNTRIGQALRIKLMDLLSIPILKLDLVESVGITASSSDGERQKFHKLFEEWLSIEEEPARITLLRALISEVEEIVPQPLKDSFYKACKTIQVPHSQPNEQGYLEILKHGKVPVISVPVCLVGFCEAGKSSLSHLLTGTKLPKATNSTKVAMSYSVTAGKGKGPWEIRTKKRNEQTLASAFKFAKNMQASVVNGKDPAKILGTMFDSLSLSQLKKPRKPSADIKPAIPADVSNMLQTSSGFHSPATNFNASPEMILPILDCGGQPMYLEAIPLLVGPRCIYCIVYNLMWKLDDYAVIKFRKDGALLQQKVSSKTYLEHIVEWISIIDCQFSKDRDGQDQPTALFIGTHFDLFVKEMNNDRMEARMAVCSIFERIRAAVADRLCSCKLHIEPFYVDNTTAGTPYEDAAASDLRSLVVKIAMEYSILAMPLSWLCLLYSLQYSSKTPHFAKHLTEVKDIAISCGVKREELGMCLQVLHRLSMLLYFHKIEDLKNYVFTDLNCFFQELGKIFTVSCKSLYENEWKHLQRTGIVTNRLQSLLFEGEFIKGWSLRVFKFLGLAGTVEKDTKTAIIPGPFFENSFSLPIFPSMIDATANSLPLKEFITFPDGKSLSPLFFVFSPDEAIQYGLMQYTPPGFFTQLISKLTEGCLFGIVLDAMDEPKTPSYSNQFTFRFGKLEIDNVTIREHSDCIQVTVERRAAENLPEFQPPEEICSFIGKEICNIGQSILQQWMPRITIQPCFFCRHCCEDHFAALFKMGPPILLNCTKTMTIYKASPQEIMWLKML